MATTDGHLFCEKCRPDKRCVRDIEALMPRGDDPESYLTDTLTAMLHFSQATGINFERCLYYARLHFENERRMKPVA
jgi:hypothetical protein